MNPFIAEILGTAIVIVLGNGVVANVSLNKCKGNGTGFLMVTIGWAMAVFIGVFVSGPISGAHLNPAVSIALAYAGKFPWADVPMYIVAQFLGAFLGATLAWLSYRLHIDSTEDPADKLGIFCNTPAIPSVFWNLVTEAIATFVLIIAVLFIQADNDKLGSVSALPIAFVILGIGLGLGGPTGYAINPARDLGPRIMHAILPIKGKGSSNWGYAWIPVVGPIIGGLVAVVVSNLIQIPH